MLIKSNKLFFCVLVLFFLIASIINVAAEETVKIGLIVPLSGTIAITGESMRDASQLAIDIVNGEYPDLKYGLGPTAGLPNLDGAKIEIIVGNSQAKPEYAKSEAERLITINKVVALSGDYLSGTTKTASQVAERYKIPFVNACSSSYDLTERGFKYFFRTGLNENIFAEGYILFLEDLSKQKGINIKNIELLVEEQEGGINLYKKVKEIGEKHGFNIALVKYPTGTADMDSEIAILKRDNPDFIISEMSAGNIILYTQTARKFKYNAPGMGGSGGGFGEIDVVKALGGDADYFFTRDQFSLELVNELPILKKVNEMFKERTGKNLDGNSARAFLGMIVLADAINRAGSTDSEAIRQALVETDMPAEETFISLYGVKFDEKGQNIQSSCVIQQRLKGELKTVWPSGVYATDAVYPMPKWDER